MGAQLMDPPAAGHKPAAGRSDFEMPALAVNVPASSVLMLAWVWWAAIIGGSFAAALAYAAYCTSRGGWPNISFGWGGFKVTCYR